MRVEFVSEGDKVFSEGDIGDKFYIVLTGRVSVIKCVTTESGMVVEVSVACVTCG
jgi:CRP-like cAMP-binding protein